MKKKILKIIILVFIILFPIIWYTFQVKKEDGNLIFHVYNSSGLEYVRMEVIVDEHVIIDDTIKDNFIIFNKYSFHIPWGKHEIVCNTYSVDNNSLLLSDTINMRIIIKWISLEFRTENVFLGKTFINPKDTIEGYNINHLVLPDGTYVNDTSEIYNIMLSNGIYVDYSKERNKSNDYIIHQRRNGNSDTILLYDFPQSIPLADDTYVFYQRQAYDYFDYYIKPRNLPRRFIM